MEYNLGMGKELRFIINLSSIRAPLTGIGRYTYEISRCLAQSPEVVDIQGFYGFRWLEDEEIRRFLSAPPLATGEGKRKRWKGMIPQVVRGLYHRVLAWRHRRRFRALKGYFYWESSYIPIVFHQPMAITIHDLSHVRFPQFHPQARVATLNRYLPRAMAKASLILSVSEFSKREIVELLGVEASRIEIVPPGVGEEFRRASAEAIASARARYSLPERYLLSVATLEPRKNLQGLCQAYSRLPLELQRRFPLVLAGARGWLSEELEAVLKPLEESGRALRLGYVAQEDLPALYSGARALAYPSFYEGYGMPVAEALRCGTRVLTSECSSMPEAGGKGAVYANPHDIESIRVALEALLREESWEIPDASHTYSWEESTERLLAIGRRAMNDSGVGKP